MAIHAVDRRIVLGKILRVTTADVEVGVEADDLPELEEAELMTLTFRSGTGGELAAAVRRTSLTHVHTPTPRLHFRLLHPTPTGLTGPREESDAGQPENNRRVTFRVQPRSLKDVPVTLRPFGDPSMSLLRQLADIRIHGPRQVVRGQLYDISLGGAGVLVCDHESWRYERGARVDVTLVLPDLSDPLLVTARVRRSQEVRIGMRYGLEFEPTPGRPQDRIERAVLEYVMGCQRQALRRRSS